MNEFVPIRGYEPAMISRSGTIISRYGKILKHINDDCGTGYFRIKLRGKRKNIHRLLAEAFIPNPDNLPMVNHKDGNKKNNSLSNLEWCDGLHNMRHAKEHGLLVKGRQVHTNILDEVQVLTISSCIGSIKQKDLAKYFKVSESAIQMIASKRNWKHLLC
jgi:hypothetical protein